MKIGMTAVFHNPHDRRVDADVYATDLMLAGLAEPLGFDSLWTVEHHFDDYCLAPDPFQLLTYFAGRTERIQLGSMVVVLPWWQEPVRIAEKASLLDHLSNGRFILGVGRGAAWTEFEGFGIPMGESRVRFNEIAKMVVDGLERGYCEFDGEIMKQKKVKIRPAPTRSFEGRRFAAAVSPESCEIAARLGLGMLIIPQKAWPLIEADIAKHREVFLACHGAEPPPCVTSLLVYCDDDPARVREVGDVWVRQAAENTVRHYDFSGDKSKITGYESYRPRSEDLVKEQISLQVIGTPEQCYERIAEIHHRSGSDHFSGVFSFAGMPGADAERSIRLFAKEVLPRLQALDPERAGAIGEQRGAATRGR
jgi:alkanesulfonate monooxygenase SsuD/methylene tetrahydromethanopterin reductase-like flavin-dependent oxidoreductase (luciferase family)